MNMNIFKWCQFRYSRRKCNVVSGQSCLFCHRLNSSFNCVCLSVSVLTCDLTLGPSLEKCPFQSRILLSTGEQNKSTAWKQCNGPSKAHSNQYTLTHTHAHLDWENLCYLLRAPCAFINMNIWRTLQRKNHHTFSRYDADVRNENTTKKWKTKK